MRWLTDQDAKTRKEELPCLLCALKTFVPPLQDEVLLSGEQDLGFDLAMGKDSGMIPIAGLVLLLALAPAGAVKAGSFQPRVQIPNVVEVESEAVKLSDLLPLDAPSELGEICTRIVLGNSPLPASQRVISKSQIEQQLREFPSALEQLEIPDRVIVTRKRRRLSAAEILTAIETFMAGEGSHGSVAQTCLSGSAALSSSKPKAADLGKQAYACRRASARRQVCATAGLNLQAPVFVTEPDPGLKVKRVEPDRVERKTRFLLWTSKEPQMLPFYVSVEGLPETADGGSAHNEQTGEGPIPTDSHVRRGKTGGDLTDSPGLLSGSSPRVTAYKGGSTQQRTSFPIVLVAAGKPAKLVVETATLRMTALVTPLQSGVQGQMIQVRNQDTHRVLKAEVVGVDLLRAELGGE
jgi:hypothetical protein